VHLFPSFCFPPLPLVLFCHPHCATQYSSLIRDVVDSRSSAAFVAAFASALCCATPDAVSQSDSASGTGLVFIASSAAAAACAAAAAAFHLAIQRKDKKGLSADARSKTRGVIGFASGVCVCKVQHVKKSRVTQP
jgi:hypothetical protein